MIFHKNATNSAILQLAAPCLGAPAADYDDKIVGGYPVNITQVPWQAALFYKGKMSCGATIIGSRWALTTAHCVYMRSKDNVTIAVGSADYSSGQKIAINRYLIHGEYRRGKHDYNIALLEFATELSFDDTVRAVKMAAAGVELEPGTSCLLSGWGTTQMDGSLVQHLRAVELPVVSEAMCKRVYGKEITPRMFCAGIERGGKGGELPISNDV